jgi:hypothetical protein
MKMGFFMRILKISRNMFLKSKVTHRKKYNKELVGFVKEVVMGLDIYSGYIQSKLRCHI